MYRISQLAKLAGLSRSTLLYYEKKGLIQSRRSANGYRYFGTTDLQRLLLLKQLQAGGFSLQESRDCIEAKLDYRVMEKRLTALDQELAEKQKARNLLAALLGKNDEDLRQWHSTLETSAPGAHFEWLKQQGFSEKDALRLRWLSKNMHQHGDYMNDFEKIFSTLSQWGPGSRESTLRALQSVSPAPAKILDIGCGPGSSTLLLAENTKASIIALDNDEGSLTQLKEKAKNRQLSERVTTHCDSMLDIPFQQQSFDVLWSEASAYIMGFENALKQWQQLIKPGGYLVISDLVWCEGQHSQEVVDFMTGEYPDMKDTQTRLIQAEKARYQIVDHFLLEKAAWDNYYRPLLDRVTKLENDMPNAQAIADLKQEIDIYQRLGNSYGYLMMVLHRK